MMIRKEIHTRTSFAKKKAEEYLKQMMHVKKAGNNILLCRATLKFIQAKRIYDHCNAEFGTTLTIINAIPAHGWKNHSGYTVEGREQVRKKINSLPDE